jgi:hypothetical protein
MTEKNHRPNHWLTPRALCRDRLPSIAACCDDGLFRSHSVFRETSEPRQRLAFMRAFSFFMALCCSVILSGCAAHVSSSVAPNIDVRAFKTIYVIRSDADTHDVYNVIQDELARRGLNASSGPRSTIPNNIDAIVTYQDYWHWDMGQYLTDLLIQFRNPKTNVLLASALSFRSSLDRKDPALMAREVLDSILK